MEDTYHLDIVVAKPKSLRPGRGGGGGEVFINMYVGLQWKTVDVGGKKIHLTTFFSFLVSCWSLLESAYPLSLKRVLLLNTQNRMSMMKVTYFPGCCFLKQLR